MQLPVNHSFENSDHYFGQTLFSSVEEAWFWFVQSYDALHSGAKVGRGHSSVIRPCEPVDIYTIAMRLFRQGFLNKAHMRVLSQYGEKLTSPNPRYDDQAPDYHLWQQAMQQLKKPMYRKGIVQKGDVS